MVSFQLPDSSTIFLSLSNVDTYSNMFINSVKPLKILNKSIQDIPIYTVTLLPGLYFIRRNYMCQCYYGKYIGDPLFDGIKEPLNVLNDIFLQIKIRYLQKFEEDFLSKSLLEMNHQFESLVSFFTFLYSLEERYLKEHFSSMPGHRLANEFTEKNARLIGDTLILLARHTKAFNKQNLKLVPPMSPMRVIIFILLEHFAKHGKLSLMDSKVDDLFNKLNKNVPLEKFLKEAEPKEYCPVCLQKNMSDFAIMDGCTHFFCVVCAEICFYVAINEKR